MSRAFIGIGSNIDAEENIRKAVHLLHTATRVVGVSTFYLTPPIGGKQAWFHNGVVEVETDMPQLELKRTVLLAIENQLGRQRTSDKNAPREIDLDIILFDDLAESEDSEILLRPFLAIPLCELHPDLVLPRSGRPIREIAGAMMYNEMKGLPEFTEQLRRDLQYEQSQS
jgi:2-amino-4-hydroxy-6-hydroxymethyldihydropteridine diphosphokinase